MMQTFLSRNAASLWMSAVLVASVTGAGVSRSLVGEVPQNPPPAKQAVQSDNQAPPKDASAPPRFEWRRGNLLAFLSAAFQATGMERQMAVDRVLFALARLGLASPSSQRFQEFDWRAANPHTLLSVVFEASGEDRATAVVLATVALKHLGVSPYETENNEADCQVYSVKLIWCEGEARKSTLGYIHKSVWDNLKTACPATSICPMGQDHWYKLSFNAPCGGLEIPDGACVWIRVTGPAEWIPCEWGILGSSCFDELTGTINCTKVGPVCGDEFNGPEGCPECD